MDKYITVKLGDNELHLCYNIAAGYELAKMWEIKDPTPENITKELIRMGQEDSMNLLRSLIYAGVVGYAVEFTNVFKPAYDLKSVSMMIFKASNEEAHDLVQKVLGLYGYDVKAEKVDEASSTKKKKVK